MKFDTLHLAVRFLLNLTTNRKYEMPVKYADD